MPSPTSPRRGRRICLLPISLRVQPMCFQSCWGHDLGAGLQGGWALTSELLLGLLVPGFMEKTAGKAKGQLQLNGDHYQRKPSPIILCVCAWECVCM